MNTIGGLEIRIRDLLPDQLSVSDLADLMKAAEEAILGAITEQGQMGAAEIRVSLVRISRRSTGLHFATAAPQVVRPAFTEVAAAVKTAKVLPLPPRSRDGVRKLQDFSHRLGMVLEFRLPEPGKRTLSLAKITPETDLFAYVADLIQGETTLYGNVERVGGATPRVVLRISEKVSVHCEVTEALAKELGRRLYTWVGVAGTARWSPFDHSVESFKIEQVLPYEDTPITEAVDRLGRLVGGYWKDVDALAVVAAFRRGED